MTNGWVVLEALATLGATVVLMAGAVVAAFYGRKANPAVEAEPTVRPDGSVVLAVRVSIGAPGVRSIRMAKTPGHTPTITVTEVLDGEGGLHDGEEYKEQPFAGVGIDESDEIVSGGETVAKTTLFTLAAPTPDLVGWFVTFFVDVPKRWRRWPRQMHWWSWAADTFVKRS
jgi:hypothetical protein